MSGAPPAQPPESIILSQFTGIKNTVTRERLAPNELEVAVNVDIDDVNQLHRRRGYQLKVGGAYHSLWSGLTRNFVVKDFMLGVLNADYSHTALTFAGSDPVAYVEVSGTVYFSSRSVSGKISSSLQVEPWGTIGGAGTWISPVINPVAEQLEPIRGRLYGAPPLATALCSYNGRIYLANSTTLWATELYLYDFVDKTKNYVQFEDEITCMGVVTDGVYVGTKSKVYFLGGQTFPLNMSEVMNYGAQPGSMVTVPAELLIPDQQRAGTRSKNAVVWMTTSGLAVGFDGGICNNLTQDHVILPPSQNVAALFRRQDGVNQYIGVTDSGGTPASSARIGDYVDAEIIRFQGA